MATKKKASSKKASSTKKAPAKKASVSQVSHFEKDMLPEEKALSAQSPVAGDTSIFTTLLAIFIVAFVVLGGYIYSRQRHMPAPSPEMTTGVMALPSVRPIQTAANVVDTPELRSILGVLPMVLFIEPDDVLENVVIVSDVVASQTQNWNFFKNTKTGDYVLQFKNRAILYRPTEQKIINMDSIPAQI